MHYYHYHYDKEDDHEEMQVVSCPECRAQTHAQTLEQTALFLNKSECPVCMGNGINVILYCGHGVCSECYDELVARHNQTDDDYVEEIATLILEEMQDTASLDMMGYTEERLKEMIVENCESNETISTFSQIVECLPNTASGYWCEFPWSDEGMMVVRHKSEDGTKMILLHHELCGQYGEWCPDTDHRPFVTLFTNGLVKLVLPDQANTQPAPAAY